MAAASARVVAGVVAGGVAGAVVGAGVRRCRAGRGVEFVQSRCTGAAVGEPAAVVGRVTALAEAAVAGERAYPRP